MPHACPIEIGSVAARPLPGVVEIEHGPHVALAHLCHHEVETCEQRVVVLTRTGLQSGTNVVGEVGVCAFAAYKDAYVPDVKGAQRIQLHAEPLSIASLSLAAQNGCIPHVCANVGVRLVANEKASVPNGNEVGTPMA